MTLVLLIPTCNRTAALAVTFTTHPPIVEYQGLAAGRAGEARIE